MKTHARIPLILLSGGLVFAATAPSARAGWFDSIYENVVSEQTNPATAPTPPTANRPAYYVAYDGGYIEAGNPIAGERPPKPAVVANALFHALASQHYVQATSAHPPSLVIIYHWGLLRRDTYQIRSIFQIQPNLRARIYLVAPTKYAKRMVRDIMDRRQPGLVHIPILDPDEITLLQLAHDNRYFVIVSAYDYPSVVSGRARLLWRTKMSTLSVSASMSDALPALLRGGANYFGRNYPEAQTVRESTVPSGRVHVGTPTVESFLPPPEVKQQMNHPYLDRLMRQETKRFTGEKPVAPEEPNAAPTADASGDSFLPPPLAARIKAYENEKSALQQALDARIKGQNPGPDTSRAIDAFDRENASRIARLTAERRAIRDELAKLAAANTNPAHGKTLQALQREFAEGVHQLETENTPAGP